MISLDLLHLLAKLVWRINVAFFTFPTIKAWLIAMALLLILTLFCLPIGLWCNFLKLEKLRVSQKVMFSIIAGSLLFPKSYFFEFYYFLIPKKM